MLKLKKVVALCFLGSMILSVVSQEPETKLEKKDDPMLTSILNNEIFIKGEGGPWRIVEPNIKVEKMDPPQNKFNYAIVMDNLENGKYTRMFYRKDIMVEPGMKYEFSFLYRTEGTKSASVCFKVAGKTYQKSYPATETWKKASLEIKVPLDGQAGILYFYLRKGIKSKTWLTDIKMTLTGKAIFKTGDEWNQEAIMRLTATGWYKREYPEYITLSRGLVTEYFKRSKEKMLFEEWRSQQYLGREVQRLDYHFKQIPVGLYFYPMYLLGLAAEKNISWEKMFDDVFKHLSEHNINTLYVGNTHWKKERDGSDELEGMKKLLDMAEKYNIKIVAQMSSMYFRPKKTEEQTRKDWMSRCIPSAKRMFAALDSHPALIAWSPKEEVKPTHAPWLDEYYRALKKLKCTKPFYQCNNNIASARYPFNPSPKINAFDRYFFKYVVYLNYLRPPRSAFLGMIDAIEDFYQASLNSGNPLVWVGASCATHSYQAESKDVVLKKNRGWVQDPETGLWNGCMRYYPPKHGMRAQGWLGITLGAKGYICWPYGTRPAGFGKREKKRKGFDANGGGLASDINGNEPPQMKEFGDFCGEIRPLAPYVLYMNRRVIDLATTEDKEVLLTTHAMEGGEETIIAVTNLHIGTIGGKSPTHLSDNDVLSVDYETGQLVGFKPAEPRDITIAVSGAQQIYDLKANCDVPVKDGKITIRLEPGEGTLLLLGTKDDAEAIRNRNTIPEK